jgi:predicted nucleic acid-binding Zn ribbon protein
MTVPHELNPLWRLNPRRMGEIYFRAARETLFALLGDDKFMGAWPGIIAALHTSTKTLLLHPHIHCLVTGGGIKAGEWVKCKKKILLPYRVVSNLFRGKVRAFVLKALDDGRLVLPEGSCLQSWKDELNRLGRVKWSVRVMEKYSHGRGVMSYLARKLRGGPILNSRIISVSEKAVVFHVDREEKLTLSLTPFEFIERYLQHVLPPGFISVRSWGLYSNSARNGDFALCRSLFGQPEYERDEPSPGWEEVLSGCLPDGGYRVRSCPVCGKPLEIRPLREAIVLCIPRAPPGEMDCAA